MILQALVGFYEQLAKEHPEKIARVGWCSRQVAFMLVLSSEGELVNVIPSDEKRGWTMMVPEQVKRTVGVAANLLCDNATYLLGIDAKGKPERARQCFEAARERHLAFLQGVVLRLQRRSAVSSKRGTLKMRLFPRGRYGCRGGFARWRESRVQSGPFWLSCRCHAPWLGAHLKPLLFSSCR